MMNSPSSTAKCSKPCANRSNRDASILPARHDTQSPIYGMPILDADKSKHVIILKRSMKPGFAGIENELFYDPKAMMLFGDAKDSIAKLAQAVKAL